MASRTDISDDETLRQKTPVPRPKQRSLVNLIFDNTRIDQAVENHDYPGSGTFEDPYVMNWIPDDTGNPLNWDKWLKWTITMVSAVTSFAVAFSSSAYTGMLVLPWFIDLANVFRYHRATHDPFRGKLDPCYRWCLVIRPWFRCRTTSMGTTM